MIFMIIEYWDVSVVFYLLVYNEVSVICIIVKGCGMWLIKDIFCMCDICILGIFVRV